MSVVASEARGNELPVLRVPFRRILDASPEELGEAEIRQFLPARACPRNAMAHSNLGNALHDQQSLEKGYSPYQKGARGCGT
jgi:hypothetical protein